MKKIYALLSSPLLALVILIGLVFVFVFSITGGASLYIQGYLPHRFCLADSRLLTIHALSDLLIGLSYQVISLSLAVIIVRAKVVGYRWILASFAVFIITCGWTHFMDLIVLWYPVYRVQAVIKLLCALSSISSAVSIPWMAKSLISKVSL